MLNLYILKHAGLIAGCKFVLSSRMSMFISTAILFYLCSQIGKYDRQFWEQSVEQEVLKVLQIKLFLCV